MTKSLFDKKCSGYFVWAHVLFQTIQNKDLNIAHEKVFTIQKKNSILQKLSE